MTERSPIEAAAVASYNRYFRGLNGTGEPDWESLEPDLKALWIASERAAIAACLRAVGPASATARRVADDALVSALEGTECPEDVVAAVCQALAAEVERPLAGDE